MFKSGASVEGFVGVLGNRSDGVSGQVEKVIERRKGGRFYTTSLRAANECSSVLPQ